jgi:putative hydrolase of the HAD superfamily
MFEDVARNLAVPKAKGMTTTLVITKAGRLDHREAHDQSTTDAPAVADFVTDDLSEFLARLNIPLSID